MIIKFLKKMRKLIIQNIRKSKENMIEYDGITREYKKSDSDFEKNINVIKNILGFHPCTNQLDFDLSFYAGGCGVYNTIAISCLVSQSQKSLVLKKYRMFSIQAILKEEWKDDFIWLIEGNDNEEDNKKYEDILTSAINFINVHKANFQDICLKTDEIFFSYECNVNTWDIIWIRNKKLNFISFDQG